MRCKGLNVWLLCVVKQAEQHNNVSANVLLRVEAMVIQVVERYASVQIVLIVRAHRVNKIWAEV
jgi:hypothetical protein